MSKGPIVTGIGNAASAKEAARLDGEADSRWWRCDCGAMAQGRACANGHPAPWLSTDKPKPPPPERVRGMVMKPKPIPAPAPRFVSECGITIDRGIAIPPRGNLTTYPWSEMAIGDSFFVPFEGDRHETKKRGSSIATSGRAWLRRNGVPSAQVIYRAVAGGVRIWRLA